MFEMAGVRSVWAVCLAVIVGVLLLFLALPPAVGVGPLSTRSAEAASAVTVRVNCTGSPEATRVKNNTNRRIFVKRVGSIHEPRDNEPFRMRVKVRPGKAAAFTSGKGARGKVLTGQYIYDNDVGSREGARVATSVGRFVGRC
jgi:hypothetical protein